MFKLGVHILKIQSFTAPHSVKNIFGTLKKIGMIDNGVLFMKFWDLDDFQTLLP